MIMPTRKLISVTIGRARALQLDDEVDPPVARAADHETAEGARCLAEEREPADRLPPRSQRGPAHAGRNGDARLVQPGVVLLWHRLGESEEALQARREAAPLDAEPSPDAALLDLGDERHQRAVPPRQAGGVEDDPTDAPGALERALDDRR